MRRYFALTLLTTYLAHGNRGSRRRAGWGGVIEKRPCTLEELSAQMVAESTTSLLALSACGNMRRRNYYRGS